MISATTGNRIGVHSSVDAQVHHLVILLHSVNMHVIRFILKMVKSYFVTSNKVFYYLTYQECDINIILGVDIYTMACNGNRVDICIH